MSPVAPGFPAMKPKELLRLLQRELGYVAVRQTGSHMQLKAPDRPRVTLAIHGKEFGPQLVRDIPVKQVGLTLQQAREVVDRG